MIHSDEDYVMCPEQMDVTKFNSKSPINWNWQTDIISAYYPIFWNIFAATQNGRLYGLRQGTLVMRWRTVSCGISSQILSALSRGGILYMILGGGHLQRW